MAEKEAGQCCPEPDWNDGWEAWHAGKDRDVYVSKGRALSPGAQG